MNSHIEIYIHFVWATWDRHPFIEPIWERDLWRSIRSEVETQKCQTLAIGGTVDHVHLLAQFHSTLTAADFVQTVKGASSHFVNDQLRPDFHFKWQGAYGAFSVGHDEVPGIIAYIKHQKQHHAENTLLERYERTNRPE
ncbi:transposase [bacterium]|nr:MAG: transposase [bacterium]